MASAPKETDPYGLAPSFEAQLVLLSCTNPRFYGRLGYAVDPECVAEEPAKLALRASRAIYGDLGHGPGTAIQVIQRLRRWVSEGSVTLEAVRRVSDYLDDAEDNGGKLDEEAVITELAPILQKRIRAEAIRAGISDMARSGDLSKLVAAEAKAASLGLVDNSIGITMGASSFAEIEALRGLERLPTGVQELDAELEGGLQRSGLGVVIGGSGDGKSVFMTHASAASVLNGMFVACATLELPPALQLARLKSAITGIPTNALVQDPRASESAKRMLGRMEAAGRLGRYVVQEFTPHMATVEDVKSWISMVEDHAGRAIDLLVVDYADKMVGPRTSKGGSQDNDYTSGRVVFEALRIYAVQRKLFCWTGSQASRRKDKKKLLDLDDVADSMHKVRVADLVITLNNDEEDHTMRFKVGKHRTGKGKMVVGPLPTDFGCGRIVATSWGSGWGS